MTHTHAHLNTYTHTYIVTQDMRLSAGAGMAITIGMARVELNYSKPLKRVAGKDFEQKWQFGLAAVYNP